MTHEIGIGLTYDSDGVGVVLIVSDDDDLEVSVTLQPDRAVYLGARLIEIAQAVEDIDEAVSGMPLEHAEAYITEWAKKRESPFN